MDKCDSIPWSPMGSASAHSALAGVIAGLVFAGIVILLERRREDKKPSPAISLLIAGFFTFALDSFLFAVIAGEQACARAFSETMVAAGMLGIGALGLFTGIAWLLHAHDETDPTPFRVTILVSYCLAIVVGLHLVLTTHDYLHDSVRGKPPAWVGAALTKYLIAVAAVIFVHALVRRWVVRWAKHMAAGAAYVTVIYVTVCAGVFGWLAGLDSEQWQGGVSPNVATAASVIPLVAAGATLVMQFLALPAPERSQPPTTPSAAEGAGTCAAHHAGSLAG
jgi:hypothetical protein